MADQAKSVRADAVKLVGNYILQSPQLLDNYIQSICDRCRDTGTSVRKSAMHILRGCLEKEGQKQSVVERACVSLISLLKDESQDIRNSTSTLLKNMWFPQAKAVTSLTLEAR